jgi:fructose-1,6-bisphosphatase/inositol monophosphatase family enzyme
MNDNQEYLRFAKSIALRAGEIIRKFFNQTGISHYKDDDTIVTRADEEINQLVINEVREKYPEHGVYGEENSFGKNRSTLWVCDPLDGTAAFTRGLPIAVFSLAFVVDGDPIMGVVYDPFTDRLYHAVRGGGAFCNDQEIRVNEARLGERDATIGGSYSPTMPFNLTKVIYELQQTTRVSAIGSLVHDAVMVADGSLVASIACGSRPYDSAAAKVIVEEAGGRVTDIHNEDQRYDGEIEGAIVSNGLVHEDIIRIIQQQK